MRGKSAGIAAHEVSGGWRACLTPSGSSTILPAQADTAYGERLSWTDRGGRRDTSE